MSELDPFEHYPDFVSASKRAKELALEYRENFGVRRDGNDWAVLGRSFTVAVIQTEWLNASDSSSSLDQEYLARSINDEIQSDQDAWARSDETGWYYDD